MQSEIFRFSIVRNPQRITSEQYKKTVVHLTEETKRYPFYKELRKLKETGADRDQFTNMAAGFLNNDKFINNISKLFTPIYQFSEWLYLQNKPNGDQIKDEVKNLFGKNVVELIQDANFTDDKISISDSIVVVSIVKPNTPGVQTDLMRARRLFFLLDYLAEHDAQSINPRTVHKLLSATVILPADLFPIPDNNAKRREENKKAYERTERAS